MTGMEDQPKSQFPGVYRKKVGHWTITALNDGYFDLPFALWTGLDAAEGEQLLRSGSRVSPPRLAVNTFLIETGEKFVLIDTGCGTLLGPTCGKVRENLAAAGIPEAAVETILCTHIHPDHTNGLIDAGGKPIFPNAEIVVHEAEVAFWLDDANMAKASEELKPQFAAAIAAFAPYMDRIRVFKQGEVIPGVEAIPLYGHTPGHSGYVIHSGDEQLLIWGDVVHSIGIQTARPEITFAADVDQSIARETRKRLFDQVAVDRLLITGMHVEFPGFGYLAREAGAYRYNPEPWSPVM